MSRFVFSLLLLITLVATTTASTKAQPHSKSVYLPLILKPAPPPPTFEEQVIALLNLERAKIANCPALNHSLQLAVAAEGHSLDMAGNNYFGHTGTDGSSPSSRAIAAGYMLSVGENIAAGQTTPQNVFNSWMSSAGHRQNMLNCSYRSTGVGYVSDPTDTFGPYRHYWTQMFGIQ
ncbi:MAG: CAP domain-containing protein [Herpetosiphonaceae bacterium]|nr:CAP domain-containing protein [Herpetosiphonaceae bacterium]